MVRHQAPGSDFKTGFAAPFSHQRYIGMIVIIAEKGLLAAIAALRDMIRNAWDYNAGDTCHEWRVSEIATESIKYTVPGIQIDIDIQIIE